MHNLKINPYKSNNISFIGKNNPKNENSLSRTIATSVKALHDRSEREVTEYDYFKPVHVDFENPDKSLYVGTVKLKISQPSKEAGNNYKTQRELEAFIYSPSKGQNVSRILEQGTKKEILNLLKDEKLNEKIKEFMLDSSSLLIEDCYQ